ncbi:MULTISPECIES: hypothetical protein [Microbulbifer]|uniref:Na+/phosphate symporter n=1 Tax=Microbulbifer rhizosphaerae TaxID=1562603 RepID=A0A7W4W7W9_9GAMM|nr:MULTISPECIES: hypothetical protein [Microbulbifer]MBB3059281.1 Na+/phosphate symporter [Microbulbifer rhizosphaerae]
MSVLRELKTSLLDWEARVVLESLSREIQRLKDIAENSTDEDEAADAGNDCLEVVGLKERLETEAASVFGDQIKDFSRDEV